MTRTPTQDLQEEFLANVRKGQETVLTALRTWVDTVTTITPKLTAYVPLTDKLPRLPNVGLPFADKLPHPQDAVDSAYQLAEQLLANQKRFAQDALKVIEPLVPGNAKTAAPSTFVNSAPVAKAEPKVADVVPAPKAPVVKAEPKVADVVTAPKAPAAKAPAAKAKPKVTAIATAPKAPVFKAPPSTVATSAAPKADAPKADAPKADAPKATSAPKADAPKATSAKSATSTPAAKSSPAAKATPAAKTTAPKTVAAKSAPKAADAS